MFRELVHSSPSDGLQYSRIEEIDIIYDFLVGFNPKFDVVRGRILGQRSIPSLMEVCFEIHLEKDRISDMNISTTPTIDSATFNAKPMTVISTMENQFLSMSIAKKTNGIPRNSVGSYMVIPMR